MPCCRCALLPVSLRHVPQDSQCFRQARSTAAVHLFGAGKYRVFHGFKMFFRSF